MFQTVLMFLASPQDAPRSEVQVCRPASRMATRARPVVAPSHAAARAKDWHEDRNAALDEALDEAWEEGQVTWLTVVGNALGFALLMTGLWLGVRLVETLLG
jgi:hypothetical protein